MRRSNLFWTRLHDTWQQQKNFVQTMSLLTLFHSHHHVAVVLSKKTTLLMITFFLNFIVIRTRRVWARVNFPVYSFLQWKCEFSPFMRADHRIGCVSTSEKCAFSLRWVHPIWNIQKATAWRCKKKFEKKRPENENALLPFLFSMLHFFPLLLFFPFHFSSLLC